MMKKLRRYLYGALIALSMTAAAFARPGVIVIGDDDGGGVDDHVKFYQRIRESGVPVRVEGICVSACTLVLMLPASQVCIAPTASFGFHLARSAMRPEPELTDALSRRYYPQAVRNWIAGWVEHNGKLTVERVAYMPGDVLVESGYKQCED